MALAQNAPPRLRPGTLAVHSAQEVADPTTRARAVPIYQTTSYTFDDAEHGARLFALQAVREHLHPDHEPDDGRLREADRRARGRRRRARHGSGQAAQFLALSTILAGRRRTSSPRATSTAAPTTSSRSPSRASASPRSSSTATTRGTSRRRSTRRRSALYVETIGNPRFNVPDFEALAKIAHEAGIPLVVDNTFGAAGYTCRPIDYGADIVVASATKWIGGHGTSIGGVIVDAGKFDWGNGKFPVFTEPAPGYHGLKFWEMFGPKGPFGNIAFIIRARVEGLRDFGPSLSPFNSFLFLQGLETLSLRIDRHNENALELARWLEKHPAVTWVSHPSLPSHPSHALAKKYLRNGFGSVLTFGIKGGARRRPQVHRQRRSSRATSRTSATRRRSSSTRTRRRTSSSPTRSSKASGVTPDLVRVSVGIEHIEDIVEDLDRALGGLST